MAGALKKAMSKRLSWSIALATLVIAVSILPQLVASLREQNQAQVGWPVQDLATIRSELLTRFSTPGRGQGMTTAREKVEMADCLIDGIQAEVPTLSAARAMGARFESIWETVEAGCRRDFLVKVLSAETWGPSFAGVYEHGCREKDALIASLDRLQAKDAAGERAGAASPEREERIRHCVCEGREAAKFFPSPKALMQAQELLAGGVVVDLAQEALLGQLKAHCVAERSATGTEE